MIRNIYIWLGKPKLFGRNTILEGHNNAVASKRKESRFVHAEWFAVSDVRLE